MGRGSRGIPQGVDLSPGVGQSVSSYIDHYLRAVEVQSRRFLRKGARLETRRIDAVWFVFALDNLLSAVDFAKKKMKSAALRKPIQVFKSTVPGLDNARDALAHFDSWRAGVGRGQDKAPDGTWIYVMAISSDLRTEPRQGKIVVRLSAGRAVSIDVIEAVDAARQLAGEAQKEIAHYVRAHTGDLTKPM